MRIIGKWLLLAGALVASPVFGQNSDQGAVPAANADIGKQLEQVNKSLENLTSRFDTLQRNISTDLKELRGKGILTDVNVAKAQEELLALRKEIGQLREDLGKKTGTTQISGYSGLGTGMGRIRLVNTYFRPATIVVNGTAYELVPNQELYTRPVPAGPFTYEVLGVEPLRERLLAANETFTVHVYPR
jgi:hypothetical protein